jgi:hypothetical protein
MVRRKLSPQIHSLICELSAIGWSPNRIHKLYLELNLSTIKKV